MDPITVVSLAATVAQLFDATSKVVKYLHDVKNAPKECRQLAREISNLLPLFNDLKYRIEDSKSEDPLFNSLKSLGGKGSPLEAFRDTLEQTATKLGPRLGIHRVTAALSWTIEKKEVDSLLAKIERLKSLIGLALQKDSFRLLQALKSDVSVGFQHLKIEQDNTKIRQWLAPPDTSSNHNAARKKWQATTGEWFTGSKEFECWKAEPASFIWLHGIPGCGKSVLCSAIIQNVIEQSQQLGPAAAVAYFYFDFNDPSKQQTDGMLRSLLTQLSAQSPSSMRHLEITYSALQNGQQQPTTAALTMLLNQMLIEFNDTFLVFDALDECTNRDELHELITEISSWNLKSLHILTTSRKEKDIEDCLESLVTCQICIQSAQVDADIKTLVLDRLSLDRRLNRWPTETKLEIEVALVAGANGMFRWVECQLDRLRKCMKLDAVRNILATLPKTLDRTYERILSEIDEVYADDAFKILQWLCCSLTPMRLDQLTDVLAIEVTDKPRFNPAQRLLDPRDVLTICSSLVSITEEFVDLAYWGFQESKTSYIRLAHYSVKEYLISARLENTAVRHYAIDETTTHTTITESCVAYLSYFARPRESYGVKDLLGCQDFPLYDYAAKHWLTHYHLIDDETCARINLFILEFLESTNQCFITWADSVSPDLDSGPVFAPPIYYMSEFGATRLVSMLLQEGADQVLDGIQYRFVRTRQDENVIYNAKDAIRSSHYDKGGINAPGGMFGNALQAASSFIHRSVVQLLLSQGANVNMQGGKYGTALVAACAGEDLKKDLDTDLVLLLLDSGADVNLQVRYFGNALLTAIYSRNEEIVRLLLDHGANVNAQGGHCGSALQDATAMNDPKMVRLLLDRGADVDMCGRDRNGRICDSALWTASGEGALELVHILLDAGAEIDKGRPIMSNSVQNLVRNALQHALFRGRADVALLLIERGAKIEAMSEEEEILDRTSSWKSLRDDEKHFNGLNNFEGPWKDDEDCVRSLMRKTLHQVREKLDDRDLPKSHVEF